MLFPTFVEVSQYFLKLGTAAKSKVQQIIKEKQATLAEIQNLQDLLRDGWEHESDQLSRYFHIGMVINPMVGVYILIVRVPTKGGMTIPNIGSLDPGTCTSCL